MSHPFLRFATGILFIAAAAYPQDTADQDWQAFRKAYPYHVQSVALSAVHADGSRTLIVAEPPPHVRLADFRDLGTQTNAEPRIRTTKIGYDGWAKDVVVTLPPMVADETRALVDRLNIYLFDTAYKSYALDIPADGASTADLRKLNIHVSAADLDRWLYRAKDKFAARTGGMANPVTMLMANGASGVYYSEKPGLVVLIGPKSPFGVMRRHLREFALDSDLILGATSYKGRIAVFARERVIPVDALPPLRTETILQLAAAAPVFSELSQSYERNNFFAGHIDQAGWDWAPVYLSDLLIDTEYGSLLNITDQLLKSWSSNGEVEYYRFPYPKPKNWPFPAPIIIDAKVQEVTFNWNTKGAGYAVDFPDATGFHRLFSLNRTGSLPVNYIPAQVGSGGENPLARYELTGYEYFAGLCDPNLVRVVQYASLYQIFREFGVAENSRTIKVPHPEWDYLGGIGARAVRMMMAKDSERLFEGMSPKALEELEGLRRSLNEAVVQYGDNFIDDVGLRLANSRIDQALFEDLRSGARTRASLTRNEVRALTANRLARDVQESRVGEAIESVIGRSDKIYYAYAEKTQPRSSGWIRTASVVVSKTTGSMAKRYYGGHNLDSKIVRYRVSSELKAGEVRLARQGTENVVLISPADVDRLQGVLRTAALTPKSEALPAAISRALPRTAVAPPRVREAALGVDPALFLTERGMARSGRNTRFAMLGGWSDAPRALPRPNPAAEFSKLGTRAITVERLSDYSFQLHVPGGETAQAALSYDAALDAVVGAMKNVDGPVGSWKLHLQGFDRGEARNFLRSAEVQFTSKENLQLAGFSSGKISSAAMIRELSEHYDFQRAVVRKTVVETGAEVGRQTDAVRFEVEIPSIRGSARPSLFMRIRLFFRTAVSEPLRAAAEAAFTRILSRSTVGQAAKEVPTAEKIFIDLKQDLKRMRIPGAETVDFEIEVNTDAGDFYVGEIRAATNCWPA